MLAPPSPPAVGNVSAAHTAHHHRRWTRLTPPPTLLARVRWVFLLFMLLTLFVTVLLLGVVQDMGAAIRSAALAASAALGVWWVWGYRCAGFPWVGDAAEGVALMTVSVAAGDPLTPVILLYVALGYRALYGDLLQLLRVLALYLAAHLGAVALAGEHSAAPLLSAAVLVQVPGLALTAGCMRVIYHVLVVHEQTVAHERRLAAELRISEQRTRQLVGMAERQAQELALLAHIQTAMAQELDLAALLHTIVDLTAHTFGYPLVSLYLRDGEVLRLQHQVGYEQVVSAIPITAGIMGRVVCSGQAVLLREVHADPTFIAAIDGITSEVCVPLVDQQHVVGVLNVETTRGVRLGEADVRIVTAVGAHAGLALGRARLHAAVREREQQYRAVVDTINEVIFHVDPAGRWTFLNPAWTTLTGLAVSESVGTAALRYVHPDDQGQARAYVQQLLRGQPAAERVDLRIVTPAGVRWVTLTARVGHGADGVVTGIAGTLDDMTERKALTDLLRYQADHDALTGLPNRAHFTRRVAQVLTPAVPHGQPVAVLFLDLDGFKQVNDSWGHAAGDQLLQVVATRLHACVRAEDLVARLGGDEFVVLVEDTDVGAAGSLAQRMIAAVEAPVVIAGHTVHISTSIGVVLSAPGQASPEAVLQLADGAMYQAKRTGAGCYLVCDATCHRTAEALAVTP